MKGTPSTTNCLRFGNLVYRAAEPDDDPTIRKMLQDNSMDSWVRLSLQREPDYFLGTDLMGVSLTMMIEDHSAGIESVAMSNLTFMPVMVNGKPENIPYLGGLRVNSPYRNKIRILKHGYASLRRLSLAQETLPICFTSIASENHEARRLLEANLKDMPVYQPLGELQTLGISTSKGKRTGLLHPASPDDIPQLCRFYNEHSRRFQYAPVLREEWLRNLDGQKGLRIDDFWICCDAHGIGACLAIWDQRLFKQTVIRGYSFPLNFLRGPYNLVAVMTGKLVLPAPGRQLDQVYIAFLAIADRLEGQAMQIFQEGLAKAGDKKAKIGIVGLSAENRLLNLLKRSFPCHVYRSEIESVVLPGETGVDILPLPPQPEVAIL